MRRIASFLLVLLLFAGTFATAYAADDPIILDLADVLGDGESILLHAHELQEQYGISVCYVVTDSLDNMTLADYAGEKFDAMQAGGDGILLLDCLTADRYLLHSSGVCTELFSQEERELLVNAYDQEETYDDGVWAYLEMAQSLLEGKALDSGELPAPDNQSAGLIPDTRQTALVVDQAGVLSPEILAELNARAEEISTKYNCETAVVFVPGTNGKSVQACADDFYDYNGYGSGSGDSGIMLYVAVNDRTFAITTYGSAAYSFTDYGQAYMDEQYLPSLKESDWGGAANAYLSAAEELLAFEVNNGAPYDSNNTSKKGIGIKDVVISLVLGFGLAFIPVSAMKGKMQSVQAKGTASDYICPGSFELSRNHDHLVNTHVSRMLIPKQDNNRSSGSGGGGSTFHTSSSGRSHGGHSGSF